MISTRVKLRDLDVSRIVAGHWRLVDWNLSDQELLTLTKQCIESGVTTFDHADIYGNYECEKLFGKALALDDGIRDQIEIVTKCGILLKSDKYPDRKVQIYDYSFDHMIRSAEKSLVNMGTDHIDLLLLHRPSPFFDPEQVARAFDQLRREGKVLHFGVSNFTTIQFEMLNSFVGNTLVTNQVEISPYCLEHFENGNMDFFLKEKIHPMAWSPMAGGKMLNPKDERGVRVLNALKDVADQLGLESVDQVVYAWLMNHPSGIVPIVGTQRIDRIRNAVTASSIKMNLEQWFSIYIASMGKALP